MEIKRDSVIWDDIQLVESLACLSLADSKGKGNIKKRVGRIRKYIEGLERFYAENEKGKPLDRFVEGL